MDALRRQVSDPGIGGQGGRRADEGSDMGADGAMLDRAQFFLSHVPMGGERVRDKLRQSGPEGSFGSHGEGGMAVLGNTDYVRSAPPRLAARRFAASPRPQVFVGLEQVRASDLSMSLWEDGLLRQGIMDGRMFFSSSKARCAPALAPGAAP